jgi:hypothetical protein
LLRIVASPEPVATSVQHHVDLCRETLTLAIVAVVVIGDQQVAVVVQPQIRVSARFFTVTVAVSIDHHQCLVGLYREPPIGLGCDLDRPGRSRTGNH